MHKGLFICFLALLIYVDLDESPLILTLTPSTTYIIRDSITQAGFSIDWDWFPLLHFPALH